MFKLYNYYNKADKNGPIGLLITILMYGGILTFNGFILYYYLVFIHMEGRLIDIFTRVTADVNHFFLPYDSEVSARYLRWIISKIQRENAGIHGTQYGKKHAAVTYHTVENNTTNFSERTTYISTYRKSMIWGVHHYRRGWNFDLAPTLYESWRWRYM